jgi:hypothetical protein
MLTFPQNYHHIHSKLGKKKKKALRHQIALETLTFTLKRYDYLNSFSFNLVTSFLL